MSTLPISILYLGRDMHTGSVTVAVLPAKTPAPTRLERLPSDLKKLHRFFARLVRDGADLRECDEASGAGYVLQRAITCWGTPRPRRGVPHAAPRKRHPFAPPGPVQGNARLERRPLTSAATGALRAEGSTRGVYSILARREH